MVAQVVKSRVLDTVEIYRGVEVEEVVGFILVGSEIWVGEIAKVVVDGSVGGAEDFMNVCIDAFVNVCEAFFVVV